MRLVQRFWRKQAITLKTPPERVNESEMAILSHQPTSPFQHALFRANSDSLAHNVRMSQKRTKADKAQREADLLDKRSSHRPPQKQGKKPREDFNQTAVRIVEEAAEKH
jgi:hypothetical protein